jgi:undecaprenyl-diphosphatase
VVWYALMAAMPLFFGFSQWQQGLRVSAQMLCAGAFGLVLYKFLKHRLVRERPFIGLIGIECAMPPLDRYSFPSGHTLHAVLFTAIAIRHVPELAVLLVPFALLVAASRVVLGLHYPTDVLAGATLGRAGGGGERGCFLVRTRRAGRSASDEQSLQQAGVHPVQQVDFLDAYAFVDLVNGRVGHAEFDDLRAHRPMNRPSEVPPPVESFGALPTIDFTASTAAADSCARRACRRVHPTRTTHSV